MSAIKIGVSACLLGHEVRYDGGHKRDRFVAEVLGRFTTLLPVCPEVESGMPVPREAMRLEGEPAAARVVTIESRVDKTRQLADFCRAKVRELAAEDLSGFILKKNSPSCGVAGVKVYREGDAADNGSGLFAAELASCLPGLPIEDETVLEEPLRREHFIERVFAYHRLHNFLLQKPGMGALVEFHSRHKLVLMAHSPTLYRTTGSLVAHGGSLSPDDLLRHYRELFLRAMATPATVSKHTNVLQHALGYFKRQLTAAEKEELSGLIVDYHDNLVPLIAPLTLLRHYTERCDQPYLKQQLYLFPDAAEAALRNHP